MALLKYPLRNIFPGHRGAVESGLLDSRAFRVDATLGNDANTGRSPDDAWQTLGRVLDESFSSNSKLLYMHDGNWRHEPYGIVVYPQVVGASASTTFSISVNGTPVFVEDRGDDRNYAHFAFTGEADIVITVSEAVGSYTLSPTSYTISSSSDGTDISFTLDRPRKLILWDVNVLTEMLFIFADPLETSPPQLGDANVTNIMDAAGGIDNTGGTDETADIQGEIDTISSGGGGVLYFPPGKYRICTAGHLNMKDDVRVYLAGGARLYYPGGTWRYIYFDNVDDASIEGRGSIDGPMIKTYGGSTNTTLQDFITLPHVDGFWAIEVEYSTGFVAYNVKIINDWSLTSDGFDIENSSNALVDDCFVYSGDDALAVHSKNQGALPATSNINFRNCVVWSGSSGCKASQESYAPTTTDVTWENIDIVSFSHRGFFLDSRYITDYSDIFLKNVRIEQWLDRGLGDEHLIDFVVWDASTGGIDSVYLLNYMVDNSLAAMTSRFLGLEAGDEVTNYTLDNFYIGANLIENVGEGNITTNAFADAPIFANTDPSIVSITATDLYLSKIAASGVFTVSRTGSTAGAITVDYLIGGLAINGTHYTAIASSITLGIGVASATITIEPISNSFTAGIKTVSLSLENDAHSVANFCLGPNYSATMTIWG